MRAHEHERLEQLLAAAGVESEAQLPGAARLTLRQLVCSRDAERWVPGLAAALETARAVGQLEAPVIDLRDEGDR